MHANVNTYLYSCLIGIIQAHCCKIISKFEELQNPEKAKHVSVLRFWNISTKAKMFHVEKGGICKTIMPHKWNLNSQRSYV